MPTTSESREKILSKLRANRRPFPDVPPAPDQYLDVTSVEPSDLVTRFTAELERLTGKVHHCGDAASAIQTVVDLVGADREIMAWDNLPLAGLTDALQAGGITLTSARARGDSRQADLSALAQLRVGITGADAGLATTGTLVLITDAQQGRLPSLLPPVHIALLRKERLFATMEAWIRAEGRAAFERSASIAFITGPSRTSDIEMTLILGVHGPATVHVVLY
jgi:L-lactate dehydrogenase complex protein LldG